MFPVLLVVYRRLAIREEQEVREQFGAAWEEYAAVTPRFVPRRRQGRRSAVPGYHAPAG
jgi:protein-S-isoprenylcysteine O-methyltransferase Ste14